MKQLAAFVKEKRKEVNLTQEAFDKYKSSMERKRHAPEEFLNDSKLFRMGLVASL